MPAARHVEMVDNRPTPDTVVPDAQAARRRQRRRADRRDHLVHEHVESRRAARRGTAREEGGREGPHGQAAHQDLARARLARGHRLPDQGRSAALSREARLRRRRVRLHDLHRQRRRPDAGDQRNDHRQRSGLRRGAVGQPQFRSADPPEPQGQLPGFAAARRRVCDCRHGAEGSHHRARSAAARTASRLSQGPVADLARDRGGDELRERPGDVPQALRRSRQREPAVEGDRRRDGPGLRLAAFDLHREAAVLRGLQDDARPRAATSRAHARSASSAIRSRPTTSARRARSSRPRRRASSCSRTTSPSSISTATARAAATTT